MVSFPYIESHRCWNFDINLFVNSYKTEDWYGINGYIRRLAQGDITLAKEIRNKWNPYLRNIIDVGGSVIDCGANEGYITVLLAKAVGETGKVIAIEPDPCNVDIIYKNLEINHLKNVIVINKIVSDKSGDMKWFAAEMVQKVDQGICVETICLDDLMEYNPSAVKIDVEGYEWPVLMGSKKLLENRVKFEVEMHLNPNDGVHMQKNYGFDPLDIMNLFKMYGYVCKNQGEDLDLYNLPEACYIFTPLS